MLSRTFLVFIGLLAGTNILFCQDNFIPGAIITLQGEKVEGMINFLEWGSNPKSVEFKSSGKVSRYKPEDLQSFSLENGELYESYQVALPSNPKKADQFNYADSIKKVQKQVFLRVEIKGAFHLLSYKEPNDNIHLFIQEDKAQPVALVYEKVYDVYPGGRKVYREDESYKRQLNYYFADCDQFYDQIVQTDYNRKAMKALFKKYSDCKGDSTIAYESKKEPGKIYVYPIIGISYSQAQISSSVGPSWYDNFDPNAYLFPTIGAGFEFVMPRNRERWSIQNEWILKRQKFTDQYSENVFANFIDDYNTEVSMVYIKMNSMFKGKFNVNKLAPFAQVGISNGLMLSNTNSVDYQQTNDGEITASDSFPFASPLKVYEFGILGSLGVEVDNRYNLEFRFEYSDGFTKYLLRTDYLLHYYIMASYKFGVRK